MRQKPPISAGAVRWLHVDADGREQWFAREPRNVASLRVETIKIDGDAITERTWTRRKVVRPPGGGWDHEGPADGASDTWIRKRE